MVEYCEAMENGWDMPRPGNGPVGIWGYEADHLTIQYCYSHDNKTSPNGYDGGRFDFDGGITNSVMQYNLSMNNEGAGYGLFQFGGAGAWSISTATISNRSPHTKATAIGRRKRSATATHNPGSRWTGRPSTAGSLIRCPGG